MNEPKDFGITIWKFPTACGKILLSDEIPVSKVFVTPFINAVKAFESPCQFVLKVKIIFEKSARLFPTFFTSPDSTVFPAPSYSSVMSPVNTK